MKKQIVLATAAVLVSGSVFATKARMQALGQDIDGSWFVKDSRNAFYNPASINGMKDYVIFETGANNGAGTEPSPNAEGGFFKSHGDLTYGVYLGRNSTDVTAYTGFTGLVDDAAALTTDSVNATGTQAAGDKLELFVGGDMGMEWGARLSYSNAKDETPANSEKKRSNLGLALGMNMGDLSAQADLLLSDKAEGGTNTDDNWEADLGLDLSVDYRMGDQTFHIGYMKGGAENTVANVLQTESSETMLEVGYSRMMEVSSTSRWFYSAEYEMMKGEVTEKVSSSNTAEATRSQLPITIGFESDATSWLTLRGSIRQNVLISGTSDSFGSANADDSVAAVDTTAVNLGATLNFGKLMVDGVIGTQGGTKTGQINLDNVMTRVGVHYWF